MKIKYVLRFLLLAAMIVALSLVVRYEILAKIVAAIFVILGFGVLFWGLAEIDE